MINYNVSQKNLISLKYEKIFSCKIRLVVKVYTIKVGPKPVKCGRSQCPCAIWGPRIKFDDQTGTWGPKWPLGHLGVYS